MLKPRASSPPFFGGTQHPLALPNAHQSDRTPEPSARYDPTHWETCSLARQETTRSAASKRRRRHLQEQLEHAHALRYEELLAAQLEALRRTTNIRRALREEENNAIALCSPRRPSSTASNSKQPQPQQQQPAPASRTLDSASVHSIATVRLDSNKLVLKHESTRLALSSPKVRAAHTHPAATSRHSLAMPVHTHVHPHVPNTMDLMHHWQPCF